MDKRKNIFLHDLESYKRDLNVLNHYVNQQALYLSKMRGISFEKASSFIRNELKKGGHFEFKDPKVIYTHRESNGDRVKKESTLYKYLVNALTNKDIIAPTLTRYINADIYETPLVSSIDFNIAQRNKNKARMFRFKQLGMNDQAKSANIDQTADKLSNNAVSGAHVTPSNPLYNKTGHSTLTSTCRITAAFANINNERLIAGNRLYYSTDIVISNFLSIIQNTDLNQFRSFMDKYNLYYPKKEDVLDMVNYCGAQYGLHKPSKDIIESFLNQCDSLEYAAILYTGDLYHLRKHNSEFIYQFISELSERKCELVDNPEDIIKSSDADYIGLAWQLQGKDSIDVVKNKKSLNDIKSEKLYQYTAATLDNIYRVLEKYSDFIKTILVSFNTPNSVANFTNCVRKSVLTGDTDSTIFTVQDWVKWYTGDYLLNEKGMAVYLTMVFLASQSIVHNLAQMSANIGVSRGRLLDITMKNEYRFDVFIPTSRSKHYYAAIGAQEGNIKPEFEYEIKGVHLRSSAVPVKIMKRAADTMKSILNRINNGEKISIIEELGKIQQLEKHILKSIRNGNHHYFRFTQIKTRESYKAPEHMSLYSQYVLWENAFAPKYGHSLEPPYSALKINTNLESGLQFRNWLDNLKDQSLSKRIREFAQERGKDIIKTFYLPEQCVQSNGIPEEIFEIMDLKRIILDNSKVFYLILETLSFHLIDDGINQLAIDLPKINIPDDISLNDLD